MILLIIIGLCLLAIVGIYKFMPGKVEGEQGGLGLLRHAIAGALVFVIILCFLGTSCLIIDSDKVGHLTRIYMGTQMPPGRIIAAPWEKGPQARILAPGFHLIAFIRVTHDIEELPIVSVPQGKYAFLVAKDGQPMPYGQLIADAWDNKDAMINSMSFMGYDVGKGEYLRPAGTKGPQLTVLPPGNYRLNRYLFEPYADTSTPVPKGFVGVVKSNVGKDYDGPQLLPSGIEGTDLSVPIVPKDYRGVWETVFTPGEYYINKKAYEVTLIDTRVQTWKYIGGYERRCIDLKIDGETGKIIQTERTDTVPYDEENYADRATVLRVEGWEVFQDSRVQIQVTPENAPFVVASVGSIEDVENKIITPNYRSIIRNVVAKEVTVQDPVLDERGDPVIKDGKPVTAWVTRPRKVLDLLYHREELENEVEEKLKPEGMKAGLTVQWVRFGDPAVPPELLIPGKRRQLAKSLMATYKQEKMAQTERVETEKERARADEQGRLMKSQIEITVAENMADARKKEGLGEKAFLEALAKGQKAQVAALGEAKTFELAYLKTLMEAVSKNPDMVKMPNILVVGQGGGLEGAAAIFGGSNIALGLKGRAQSAQPTK